MCDYSLHLVASRPAKVGDKLVSTKFATAITRGFAAVEEPNMAVCLLPGTEVAFEREVVLSLLPKRRVGQKTARFRKIDEDKLTAHHDALEFADGQILLLTRLCEGQHVTVLQLPAASRVASEVEAQKQEAGVA
jgi:hypothetical protein